MVERLYLIPKKNRPIGSSFFFFKSLYSIEGDNSHKPSYVYIKIVTLNNLKSHKLSLFPPSWILFKNPTITIAFDSFLSLIIVCRESVYVLCGLYTLNVYKRERWSLGHINKLQIRVWQLCENFRSLILRNKNSDLPIFWIYS